MLRASYILEPEQQDRAGSPAQLVSIMHYCTLKHTILYGIPDSENSLYKYVIKRLSRYKKTGATFM